MTRWSPPFEVGEKLESGFEFTKSNIRSFASTVGDVNPLHHNDEAAEASQFGVLIASSTHSIGVMLAALSKHVSARTELSLGLECQFRLQRAVPAGLSASIVWTVDSIREKASLGGYIVTFDGELRDGDAVYVKGQMDSLLRESHKVAKTAS